LAIFSFSFFFFSVSRHLVWPRVALGFVFVAHWLACTLYYLAAQQQQLNLYAANITSVHFA
jgi:hypothetical protein